MTKKLIQVLDLGVSVEEEEIRQWYDVRLAALKNTFETSPGTFKSQQDLYDKHGGVEPLTVPEGYVYVWHILLETEETAKQVLEKLQQGADFKTLMQSYSIDTGATKEPFATVGYLVGPYASGMDYYDEFKAAALALEKEGDCTGVVQTPAGYEIIQLIRRLEPGDKPYEAVRGQIYDMLLSYKKETALAQLLQDWTA